MSRVQSHSTAEIDPILNLISRWAVWLLIILGPMLLYGLFRYGAIEDPTIAGPTLHFYVVTITSGLVIILATIMRYAAGQLNDPRALFLSLAFFAISGIFLVHAITTPGVLVEFNPWVGFSSRLSIFAGAMFLFLSTLRWTPVRRTAIIRHQRSITAVVALSLLAYAAIAMVTASLDRYPLNLPAVLDTTVIDLPITVVTFFLLGYVIIRYGRIYRSSHTPLVVGILVSAILLMQSHLIMVTAPLWNASWWIYHVLMLVGFIVALTSLMWEYLRARSFQTVVGGLLLRDSITQVEQGYTDVIVALIEAVEAKDGYTRGHTQRVAELSMLIGEQMGLSETEQRILNQSAVLHDIGKIGIPDAVLNKPGSLTDEEFELIKSHPDRGYRIIRHVRSLEPESEGVRYHHERMDGSGYPDGLKGRQIPLIARIIAVADVFDALTSPRSYRGAFSVERAIAIIEEERGTKLDPACVDAFLAVLPVWRHRMSLAGIEQFVDAEDARRSSPGVATSKAPAERSA